MDEVGLLAGVPLLSGLEPDVLARIAGQLTVVRIEAGQLLVRQGEVGNSLYILRSGRVEVRVDGELVRTQARGAVIGEQALIGAGVRTATVRAVRDSELLALSRAAFEGLLAGEAAFGAALVRELSMRMPRADVPAPAPSSAAVLAVMAGQPGVPVDLARQLAERLSAWGTVDVLDQSCAEPDNWARVLDAAEHDNRWTVLVVADAGGAWAEFCRRQADRVLVVVDPAKPSAWSPVAGPVDLVLLGRTRVAHWLDRWAPRAHHFVQSAEDVPRLARRVAGRSVGVVLSGGGARGLAHIGALDALRAAGVAIDRVGGTSMGAFVAGLCATGASGDEMRGVARREFAERNPFGDYTWPRHSVIRARRATAMLDRVFGAELIEGQPLGLFCVSTDLVAAQEVVHRRGRIAAAVARSMSLPGIAPPIRSAAALHVDGGVLNNLPVDVMAADGEGPVIAVDVMRPFDGPPVGLPGIVDTITRSMVLGSWRKVEANRALARVLITPRLDGVAMFDFTRLDEIVRQGRESAERALDSVNVEEI